MRLKSLAHGNKSVLETNQDLAMRLKSLAHGNIRSLLGQTVYPLYHATNLIVLYLKTHP